MEPPNRAVSAFPSHNGAQPSPPPADTAQLTAVAALSQHQQAGPHDAHEHENVEGAAINSRKRKAPGAPGNRGVANLTPEQLAKKRANDREAQRAIRERTKNHIEGLERRIKELESQQPFQELQQALRERDHAEQECVELRQKLRDVAQVVGGGVNGGGRQQQQYPGHVANGSLSGTLFTFDDLVDPTWLTRETDTELAALTAQQSPLPPLQQQQQQQAQQQQHYSPVSRPQYEPQVHPDLQASSYPPATHTSPVSSTSTAGSHTYAHGQSQGGAIRSWSPSLEHASDHHPPQQQYASQPNGVPHDHKPLPSAHPQPPHTNSGERLGLNFVLDSTQQRPSTASPHDRPTYTAPSEQPRSAVPVYAQLPNNAAATCPLDSLLIDFIASRRALLASGAPMHEVLGPEYPSWAVLHDPSNSGQRDSCHPVSALLIDILSKFPDISRLADRVAVLYIMFLLMRWFICPCEGCYTRLPEWVRPIPEQLEKGPGHAVWMDNVPWPGMRKILATSFATEAVRFEDFFVPYTTSISLNWPYSADEVLMPAEGVEGAAGGVGGLTLNPSFESHLRVLGNWSLGRKFEVRFPELIGDGGVRIEGP